MGKMKKKRGNVNLCRGIGIGCIIAGGLLIGWCLLSNLLQRSAKDEAIEAFENERVVHQLSANDDEEAPDEAASESETAADEAVLCILRIPAIDSTEPVRDGSTKAVLANALGHMEGTAYPGEVGNCVIAGHRNYSFGKFFNRLDEVKIGDYLYIDTLDETYTYEVTQIKVVEPQEVEILEDTKQEQLTLFTCTPIYIATHRLVVIARRID